MEFSIRLHQESEQLSARGHSSEKALLEAARDLKYLLDMQPPNTLFNPGGRGDARTSATYARAAALIADAATQGNKGTECRITMRISVMPTAGVVSDESTGVPADLLKLLSGISISLSDVSLKFVDENGGSGKHSRLFELVLREVPHTDMPLKQVEGKGNTVHCVDPKNVVEHTFCHADQHEQSSSVGRRHGDR